MPEKSCLKEWINLGQYTHPKHEEAMAEANKIIYGER